MTIKTQHPKYVNKQVPDVSTPAPYNFNVKLVSDKGNEIGIDTAANYGYWEHRDGSEGGGLWFEPNVIGAPDGTETPDGKLILTDYDGTSVLPASIVRKLREAGYIVDESFE